MSDIYSDLQKVAGDVFGDFNQGLIEIGVLTTTAGTRPDQAGTSSYDWKTVKGVAKTVSEVYIDNANVLQTDLEVSFAAGVVEPEITFAARIDGVQHEIVRIMRKPAAGTPVSYTLIVRK